MIEFQTEPDPIFLAILTEALRWTRESLRPHGLAYDEEEYPRLYETLARFFSRDEALTQTEQLLSALHDETIHRISDYHWLILHEALEMFADLHNDGVFGPEGRVGSYIIDTIDHDYIVNRF